MIQKGNKVIFVIYWKCRYSRKFKIFLSFRKQFVDPICVYVLPRSWRPFNFSKDQVRILLFRECDWRGRKLLFDSKAVQKVRLESQPCRKLKFGSCQKLDNHKSDAFVEVTNGFVYQVRSIILWVLTGLSSTRFSFRLDFSWVHTLAMYFQVLTHFSCLSQSWIIVFKLSNMWKNNVGLNMWNPFFVTVCYLCSAERNGGFLKALFRLGNKICLYNP